MQSWHTKSMHLISNTSSQRKVYIQIIKVLIWTIYTLEIIMTSKGVKCSMNYHQHGQLSIPATAIFITQLSFFFLQNSSPLTQNLFLQEAHSLLWKTVVSDNNYQFCSYQRQEFQIRSPFRFKTTYCKGKCSFQ